MIRRTYCPADTRFTTFRKHASNGGHYCWDSQGPSYELPGVLLYDEEYFLYSTTNDRGENKNRALRPIYKRVSDYNQNEFIIKTWNQMTLRRPAANDYDMAWLLPSRLKTKFAIKTETTGTTYTSSEETRRQTMGIKHLVLYPGTW